MSSGQPPYFFFHLARSVGWPNISLSMMRAVLPTTDRIRIALANAITAMSMTTKSCSG
jgi:hypothetical protein